MAGLLVALTISMMGLTKWIQLQNSNVQTEEGAVTIEVPADEVVWTEAAKDELMMIQERLANENISKVERERLEAAQHVLDYRLANSVEPLESFSREEFIMDPTGMGSIVLLLTVIAAAGIVAVEFSQGTIKMLLARPVKRWKILTSKFVAVNLFGVLLMVTGYVLTIVCAYLLFDTGAGKALEWNGRDVVEVSIWGKGLYLLLLSFGNVFIISVFAFMIGCVFRSSSLAIGLSLFIYFSGSMVVAMLSKYEIAKYLLFTHMDLTQFDTGMMLVEDLTMPFSLAVVSVYMLVFLFISYGTFIKRDVTA